MINVKGFNGKSRETEILKKNQKEIQYDNRNFLN